MKIFAELPLDGTPVQRIGGKDLCQLLGISSGALSELKSKGIAVHIGHDAYDLERTVNGYVKHLREVAAGWGTGEKANQLTAERARLAKEQADAQALKNAKARGELVDAAEIERGWADLLRQVRARFLAVPPRLRQVLDLSPRDAEIVDRELRDALSELGNADD